MARYSVVRLDIRGKNLVDLSPRTAAGLKTIDILISYNTLDTGVSIIEKGRKKSRNVQSGKLKHVPAHGGEIKAQETGYAKYKSETKLHHIMLKGL